MPSGGRDIGYYTLPIVPSFAGGITKIDRDLDKVFGNVSKSASKALGDGIADGAKSAEAAVKRSSDKIAALRDKEADAAGRLRIAEERLNEVRDKGAKGSQLARAEEAHARALRQQGAAAKSTAAEVRDLARAQKALEDAQNFRPARLGGADRFVSGITNELNGVTGRFSGLGDGAGKAFAGGVVAAIVAGSLFDAGAKAAGLVYDGFKSVVDTGIDFERTLNNFQGVTRSSAAEMSRMQSAARSLGSDVHLAGASSSDAALAMTELAKAGFSVDQAIGAARGTLELATAGQIDAAKAAEIQSNAMNAFGLSADQAAHVADVLANAAIASSADIPDLGMALAQVGGIAHGFGENLDDTVAALGMFANAGVKGSDAGTLLKTTMQSITDQGGPAQDAIKSLGLELYKVNEQGDNQFVGFRELFRQLDDAKKRLNDPEQFQALTNILFGSDAMRSAMLGTVADFDDMANKLERVGAAGEMAQAQMQGLPGAVEGFQNTLESVQLDVFDGIGPALTTGINEAVSYMSEHKPEIILFFTDIADQALSTGEVFVKSFGLMSEGLGQIVGGLGNVFGSILKTGSWLQRITGDTKTADEWNREADAMFGWGESMQSIGRTLKDTDFDKLRDDIRESGERAKVASEFTTALGDAMSSLKVAGRDITIDIRDNTPELRARLTDAQVHLEQMANDPTRLRLVADTAEADSRMNAFREQQGADPVDVTVNPTIDPAAQARFDEFARNFRAAMSGAPQPAALPPGTVNRGPMAPGSDPFAVPRPRAAGGIDGGWQKMPGDAHIGGPVYPDGLVRYREPSTKGEAYIPLNGSARSRNIWQETGRRLGVWAFDEGGFYPDVNAAESLAGTPYSQGSRTDCSGMVARVINRALGLPDTGLMSTKNAKQWLTERGFQPGIGGPGTISVGWYDHGPNPNDGHMAMTLSNGQNAEAGGSNGVFTIGSGASGASDAKFDQQMYLPVWSGEGPSADGPLGNYRLGSVGGSGSGGGRGGIPAGATAGVDPTTGESGYYMPDAKQVRDAEQRVTDADARVKEAEARQRELDADAKESQRISAQAQVDKAKREAEDARADLSEAKRGKFTKSGRGQLSGDSGGGDLSGIGGIFGSFLKETFGLDGSLFPDISNLMPVQMLGAALGAFKGPIQGALNGQLGIQQPGWQPGTPVPAGPASGLPFGMAGTATAEMAPPGTPASGTGFGPAPGPIHHQDFSRNNTVNVTAGANANEIGTEVRRQMNNVERLHSYVPKGS